MVEAVSVVGTESSERWKCDSIWSMGFFDAPFRLDSGDDDSKALYAQLVEIKSCDDDDWEEWREKQTCIGGSSLAAILGVGYESPRSTLIRCLEGRAKPPPSAYSKTAMAHGKHYEKYAAAILKYYENMEPVPNNSYIFKVYEKKGPEILVCVSPDIEINGSIWEIKCPYNGMSNAESAQNFCDQWLATNGNAAGKPAYFIQAGFYAWLRNCDYFSVVVCFVYDCEQIKLLQWDYEMTEALRDFFCDRFQKIMHSTKTSYRVTADERNDIDGLMKDHVMALFQRKTWRINMDGSLSEEQAEDSCTCDGESPPRE